MKPTNKNLICLFLCVCMGMRATSALGGDSDVKSAILLKTQDSPSPGNLVPNPGFEAGRGGPEGWTLSGEGAWRTAVAHGGARSVEVDQTRPDQGCLWTSDAFVAGAGNYTVAAWMKGAKIYSPDPNYGPKLEAEFLDGENHSLGRVLALNAALDVKPIDMSIGLNLLWFDWQFFEGLVTAPSGTAKMRLFFGLQGARVSGVAGTTGIAWLDDVTVMAGDHRCLPSAQSPLSQKTAILFNTARDGGWQKDLSAKPCGTVFLPGEKLEFLARITVVSAETPVELHYAVRTINQETVEEGVAQSQSNQDFLVSLPNASFQTGVFYQMGLQALAKGMLLAERNVSFGVLPPTDHAKDHALTFFGGMGLEAIPPYLELGRRLGMTFVRQDFFFTDQSWPAPDQPITLPDNSLFHNRIVMSRQLGIQPLINIQVTVYPKWAEYEGVGAEDHGQIGPKPECLAKFVRAVVSKYKDKVQYWQFGNEVDPITPAQQKRYGEQFIAFSQAVHETDPQAQVVIGSLHGLPPAESWLFNSGILKYVDVLDFHYMMPKEVARIRAKVQEKTGRDIPTILTEVAAFDKTNDLDRSRVMAQLYIKYLAVGVKSVMWCHFGSWLVGDSAGETSDDVHGMFLTSLAHMPGRLFFTHYQMEQLLQGQRFVAKIEAPEKIEAYRFEKNGRTLVCLWSEKEGVVPLKLSPAATEVEYRDLLDHSVKLSPLDGHLHVAVGNTPIFLSWDAAPATIQCADDTPLLELKTTQAVRGADSHLVVNVSNPSAKPIEGEAEMIRAPGLQENKAAISVPAKGEATARIPFALAAGEPVESREALVGLAQDQRMVALGAYPLSVVDPVKLIIKPAVLDRQIVPAISVENSSPTEVKGELRIVSELANQSGPQTFIHNLAVPSMSSTAVAIPAPPDFPIERSGRIWAAFAMEDGKEVRAQRSLNLAGAPEMRPVIDGDLSEWQKARPFCLRGDRGDHFTYLDVYNRQEESGRPGVWHGDQDLAADLRFAWDDQFLYLAMQVQDDTHCNRSADWSLLWNGDAIEIAIESRSDDGQGGDWLKIISALTDRGPECSVFQTGKTPVNIATKGGKVQIVSKEGKTFYEVAVPWKLLPIKPVRGKEIGISFAVSDDDGLGRTKFLMHFGSITSPDCSRWLFGTLLLE